MQKKTDAEGAAAGMTRDVGSRGNDPRVTKKNQKKQSTAPQQPGSPEYVGAMSRMLNDIGLCVRARALIRGTDAVCGAMKSGGVRLVLSACDNSPNTAKRLSDRCAYYGVRLMALPATGEQLAAATGCGGKVAAVGITDASMVRMIEKAALPLGI